MDEKKLHHTDAASGVVREHSPEAEAQLISGREYFDLAGTADDVGSNPKCPCCESEQVAEYEICSTCGWQRDPVQECRPHLGTGANKVTLAEARQNYRMSGHSDPERLRTERPRPLP